MQRILFVPDCHHKPGHRTVFFNLMLDVARDFKPHQIYVLGDFWDCYSVSRYDKHPQKMFLDLEEELVTGKDAFRKILELKAQKVFFLEGNHEARVATYMRNNAPALLTKAKTPQEVFEIPSRIPYLPYGTENFLNLDGLFIHHGTVLGKTPAMKALDKFGKSVLFGHSHRLQEAHKTLLDGSEIHGYNIGWLGDTEEVAGEYISDVADWTHGFALGWFPKSGKWNVNLVRLDGYEAIVMGKQYDRSHGRATRHLK